MTISSARRRWTALQGLGQSRPPSRSLTLAGKLSHTGVAGNDHDIGAATEKSAFDDAGQIVQLALERRRVADGPGFEVVDEISGIRYERFTGVGAERRTAE